MVTPQGTVTRQSRLRSRATAAIPAGPCRQPAGETQVTGLLRISEPGDGFLRRNDPAAGRWYSRDVAAIAAARGLVDVAPFFVDADAASSAVPSEGPGGPRGGLTVVAFNNHHLIYADTWFVLALMAGGAGLFMLLPERRRDVSLRRGSRALRTRPGPQRNRTGSWMTRPAKTWKAATPGPFWITEYCGSTKVLMLAPLGSSNTLAQPQPDRHHGVLAEGERRDPRRAQIEPVGQVEDSSGCAVTVCRPLPSSVCCHEARSVVRPHACGALTTASTPACHFRVPSAGELAVARPATGRCPS